MIEVNGVTIAADAIAREMQHHPAASREDAEHGAATALVIRELLLQRVRDREIPGADDDQKIANLIASEVSIPEPTSDEVARYFRRNTLQFMSAPLYEAAHIFFPARPDEGDACAKAKAKAEALLEELRQSPAAFAGLARAHSACASKDQGGSLGQVSRGDTNPELERAMATMNEGSIAVVKSRHGYHVVRLDRRVRGSEFPLEAASGWIKDHLRKCSERRAVSHYLQMLAASARISGIQLQAAGTPLMQ